MYENNRRKVCNNTLRVYIIDALLYSSDLLCLYELKTKKKKTPDLHDP